MSATPAAEVSTPPSTIPRKRPPPDVDPNNIIEGGRAIKRQRGSDSYAEGDEDGAFKSENLKEYGMRLLNAVKGYKEPESDRLLSLDFQRLVPKKLYPDYYKIIARPVALDTVKKKLDEQAYKNLREVRDDLNLIFRNAKTYNMKESGIYVDAQTLQRLLFEEWRSITGTDDQAPGTDKEDAALPPVVNNQGALEALMTETTVKLTQSTDPDGTQLAFYFMELPDKKSYPSYYTIITKPVCFKQILSKIKRHEYKASSAWAADVDRIFSNAQKFNEDGSIVHNQATALQTHFNQLLSEFPPEYKVERPKVKVGRPKKDPQIKVEGTPPVIPPPQRSLRGRPSEGSAPKATEMFKPKLESETKPSPTPAPRPVPSRQQSGTPATAGTPAATKPAPAGAAGVTSTTFSTRATSQAAQNQRPSLPIYQQPVVPSRSSGYPPRTLPPGPPVQASFALGSNNMLPEGIPHNPMTLVTLKTLPIGRMIYLDALDGVSTWSIRLAGGTRESAVSIEGIEVEPDEEEGEEEEAATVKTRNKRTTRSGLTNGNGYPKGKISDKYLRELQVKVNGRPITPQVEGDDPLARQWTVELCAGGSVLDIGAWRVFLDQD